MWGEETQGRASSPKLITVEDLANLEHRLDVLTACVNDNRPTLKDIKSWWPLIISAVSIVVLIVTMSVSIEQLRTKDNDIISDMNAFISKQEIINKERDVQMSEISIKLAEIQKDILYIRATLDKHMLTEESN